MTTATTTTTKVSFREAINQAVHQEMARDESVILMGEDVAGGGGVEDLPDDEAWGGVMGVTKGLAARFGRDRVRDTPISESAFVGAGVGTAATGLRPIVEVMFVEFAGVCLDQIVNQGAKMRYMFGGRTAVPLTIRTMIGGGLGAAAQHSGVHYSIFTHYPGLKTVCPSTPADAKGLLTAAIRDDDPVVFFEHKLMYGLEGEVPEGEHLVPLGTADVKREGSDATVVAIGRMVSVALEAAESLAADGIDAEVVDLRSLSPLDEETLLGSVRKTGRLVMVDEDNPRCSVAADVLAIASRNAFDALRSAPQMVTPPHTPNPFSPVLEQFYLPDADQVAAAVRRTL